MSDPVVDEKLIIIGLDGATWKIIDPLVQKGQLPNLARLIREGASGNLRSLDPMISTMLWTTISSGKLPDKHGIRDFAVSSKAVRCKRIWDILAQQGLTVGVYGHMITWPPDPIQGFMVPGSFAMGSETHPPDLSFLRKLTLDETSGGKRHYAEYLGYGWKALKKGVSPRTLFQMAVHLTKETLGNMDPLSDFYRKRLLKLRLDREVFLHLCRKFKPHLAYFYTHLLDSTQHLFWKYMEPDNFTNIAEHDVTRYGQFIFEAYREADKSLGQILSALGSDTTVIVVSDHGGEALSCSVEESAVTIKTENLLKKLGLWGQVRAVNIGFELYIYPKGDDSGLRARIQKLFEEIVIEGTSLQVFKVTPVEFSYLQIQVEHEKVKKLKGSTVRVGDVLCPFEEVVEFSLGQLSGGHHPDGICILWGKSIKAGEKLLGASILDVTPTALMLMGLPVARDMDGKPLVEAVDEQLLQTCPVTYRDTYEDKEKSTIDENKEVDMPEELVKKLKTLGYLG